MAHNPPRPTTRPNENPRTKRMRDAVLSSVVELTLTEGAGAVTALRVSEHACVARSTIYEHWPTSDALLLDAIDMVIAPHTPVTATDDLGADLYTALTNLRERLQRQPFRIWFATLLDHANRDEAFAAAQLRFVTGVLQPTTDLIAAAQNRREIDDDLDISQATAQLAAPILTLHVLLRAAASDDLIAATITHFLTDHATKS